MTAVGCSGREYIDPKYGYPGHRIGFVALSRPQYGSSGQDPTPTLLSIATDHDRVVKGAYLDVRSECFSHAAAQRSGLEELFLAVGTNAASSRCLISIDKPRYPPIAMQTSFHARDDVITKGRSPYTGKEVVQSVGVTLRLIRM